MGVTTDVPCEVAATAHGSATNSDSTDVRDGRGLCRRMLLGSSVSIPSPPHLHRCCFTEPTHGSRTRPSNLRLRPGRSGARDLHARNSAGRANESAQLGLAPNNVLVVSPVYQRVNLAFRISAKQPTAFNTFAKEQITGLREEPLLRSAGRLRKKRFAFARHFYGFSGRELIHAGVVGILGDFRSAQSGIVVVPKRLFGDDLPYAVASQPGVGRVISSPNILAGNGFGFVHVVGQDRRAADDAALRVIDRDCP